MSVRSLKQFCFKWGVRLAWMPDEFSPAHNIWGREVRSGIAPLGRNSARTETVRTNQIVRAGFIQWWTDDNSNLIKHVTKERLGWICFQQTCLSKMLIVLVSSPCILKFFLQHRQKSFLLIFFFCFFQRACSWVLLTTTMRHLTYVTYSVALIGCRSIQLSEEAFFFLVRLKHAP